MAALSKDELVRWLAIIVTSLGEEGGPEGHLYAGCGMGSPGGLDLDSFQQVMGIAKKAGLLTVDVSHWVALTPKGAELAKACEEAQEKVRAARQTGKVS